MVDPTTRRRGIGTALLGCRDPLIAERGYTKTLLVCPRASDTGAKFAAAKGGELDHSEHALKLFGAPTEGPTDPAITLRAATADDADARRRAAGERVRVPTGRRPGRPGRRPARGERDRRPGRHHDRVSTAHPARRRGRRVRIRHRPCLARAGRRPGCAAPGVPAVAIRRRASASASRSRSTTSTRSVSTPRSGSSGSSPRTISACLERSFVIRKCQPVAARSRRAAAERPQRFAQSSNGANAAPSASPLSVSRYASLVSCRTSPASARSRSRW